MASLSLSRHASAALMLSFIACGLAIGIALLEPPPYVRLPCVPALAGMAIGAIWCSIRLLRQAELSYVSRVIAITSLLLSLLDLYAARQFLRPSLA